MDQNVRSSDEIAPDVSTPAGTPSRNARPSSAWLTVPNSTSQVNRRPSVPSIRIQRSPSVSTGSEPAANIRRPSSTRQASRYNNAPIPQTGSSNEPSTRKRSSSEPRPPGLIIKEEPPCNMPEIAEESLEVPVPSHTRPHRSASVATEPAFKRERSLFGNRGLTPSKASVPEPEYDSNVVDLLDVVGMYNFDFRLFYKC